MVVVDASAVLELLKGSAQGLRLLERYLEPDVTLHSPHLIDAEVLHALRRWTFTGGVSPERARERLELYQGLSIRRHAHGPFLDRAWQLRANLSGYDALYVAVAEGLGLLLLTADARLAKTAGHRARIQLV